MKFGKYTIGNWMVWSDDGIHSGMWCRTIVYGNKRWPDSDGYIDVCWNYPDADIWNFLYVGDPECNIIKYYAGPLTFNTAKNAKKHVDEFLEHISKLTLFL